MGFQAEKGSDPETLGSLVLDLGDGSGRRFQARPAITAEERADIWKRRSEFIGKTAVVKFQELTADGIPRFPVVNGFRADGE